MDFTFWHKTSKLLMNMYIFIQKSIWIWIPNLESHQQLISKKFFFFNLLSQFLMWNFVFNLFSTVLMWLFFFCWWRFQQPNFRWWCFQQPTFRWWCFQQPTWPRYWAAVYSIALQAAIYFSLCKFFLLLFLFFKQGAVVRTTTSTCFLFVSVVWRIDDSFYCFLKDAMK